MKTHEPQLIEGNAFRRLAFDPTPAGLTTGKSLRKAFKGEWKRIREKHFKDGDLICEICHSVKQSQRDIDGHEIYLFLEAGRIKLDRVIFICKLCHDAVHLERTRGKASPDYIREVESHYCEINGDISESDLRNDYWDNQTESLRIRQLYSLSNYSMDYGVYQDAVNLCLSRKRKNSGTDDDDDGNFEMYPDHECPWDINHANS